MFSHIIYNNGEEGENMEQSIKKYNEYANAALALSLLSMIGSFLSVIDAIPLIITYQLLQQAKKQGLSKYKERIIVFFFITSLLLTLCITIFYTTIL